MNDNILMTKGLPCSLESERFLLASILHNGTRLAEAASVIDANDLSLESNRKIFQCMVDLQAGGTPIDRITVANELIRRNHLDSVGGVTYLVSLDDDFPTVINMVAYAEIVKEKSNLRKIIYITQKSQSEALLNQSTSDDIIKSIMEPLMSMSGVKNSEGPMTVQEIIDTYPGGLDALLQPHKYEFGVPTGFCQYDAMTRGFHGGELVVIAARPNVGKTSLALNIAHNISMAGKTVFFLCMEMRKADLLRRLCCARARVDSMKFKAGAISVEERIRIQKATSAMAASPILFDDTYSTSVMDVYHKIQRIINSKNKLDLVVIDYLQLLRTNGKAENRNIEVGQITRALKLMARQFNIPILLLCQLSRASERRQGDRRPQLSDIRDSGEVEQNADTVGLIYRHEMYRPDIEESRGKAELILAKQRNGPTGTIKLAFLKQYTKFENLAEDTEPEEDSDVAYGD